jgi:two-component system, OmpR family, copper resistance phosphate regulon response regulator CusR
MKILLIEDEPKIVQSLHQGLEEHQFEVDTALDGIAGRDLALKNHYVVIISDVLMPGMSGLELVQDIRKAGNTTPVLLLTALGQTDDKITGFEAGADDYLTKPFEFRELLVRIRALARRSAPLPVSNLLRFADVTMNLDMQECFRDGKKITLTPREFELMEYFLRNPERYISKTEIMEKVWNMNFDTGTNVVEVYINFLRKKIDTGFSKKIIHTHFKGYRLREEEEE